MRVLTVLEMLQTKERVSAAELAARLEVSVRTVQRYVARLQDLGVPVSATKGRGAAYYLKPSFRMPPIMFNAEEAFAVALGLNALQHVGLNALAPALVGVESKLERILPPSIWARMQALSSALQLEKAEWIAPVDTDIISSISEAIRQTHQIEMQYQNQQGVGTQRTVQPLGLVREGGAWFLAAYCLLRQDQRLFRADRISNVHNTGVVFAPPEQFNGREFTKERLRATPAQYRVEIWLDATPETLRYDLVPTRAELIRQEHGFLLRSGMNNLEGFAARLLEMNCNFEIIAPPELKAAFGRLAKRAMQVFEE